MLLLPGVLLGVMLLVAVVLLIDVLLATLPVEVVRVVRLLPIVLLDDARLVAVVGTGVGARLGASVGGAQAQVARRRRG